MRNKKSNNLFIHILFFLIFANSCARALPTEIKGMIFIPQGMFILGSTEKDVSSLGKEYGNREGNYFDNSKPERKVSLKGFYIDMHEVTNQDYKAFVKETGHEIPLHWNNDDYGKNRERHPVANVSWYSAEKYCNWAGKRLPSESEWEKAARGPDGNRYPWGNEFDETKTNLGKQDSVPVGSMQLDKSVYGIYDMGGNVSEWTTSWYKAYGGSAFQSPNFGETHKVAKGGYGTITGHYNLGIINAQSSHRKFYPPLGVSVTVGFRCAKDFAE